MKHILVQTCETAQRFCREIKPVMTVPVGYGQTLPHALLDDLDALDRRTRLPEVRVLVAGPLKSGKSSFLNALVATPLASPIGPLPGYPCFIEVRDRAIDPATNQLEHPVMILRRRTGEEERLKPAAGRQRMAELLQDFLLHGDAAAPEFDRVVQRIDLSSAMQNVDFQGLKLVLVDSPGSFFRKFLDTADAPAVAAQYEACDIVVFVVRSDQLFLHGVIDQLTTLLQAARSKRVFILVNASRRGLTQDNGEIRDYDQVVRQDDLRAYFLKHVSDRNLRSAVDAGHRVSLHVTDLLEVTQTLFTVAPAAQPAPSLAAIEAIRQYLLSTDLHEKKLMTILDSAHDLVTGGQKFLRDVQLACDDEKRRLKAELASVRHDADLVQADIQKLNQQIAQTTGDATVTQSRLQAITSRNVTTTAADPAVRELRGFANRFRDEHSHLPATDHRPTVVAIYGAWLEGRYGDRTLLSLADAVWTQSAAPGTPSLAQTYADGLRASCVDFFTQASSGVSDQLLATAAQQVDAAKNIKPPSANPLRKVETPALLEFEAQDGRVWGAIKKLFTGSALRHANDLWGADGTRVIANKTALQFLGEQADHFVTGIWGPPWDLKSHFEPRAIAAQAVQLCEHAWLSAWATLLEARIGDLQHSIEQLQAQLRDRQRAHEALADRAAELESFIAKHDTDLEDLERRSDSLLTVFEPLKKLLTNRASAPA